MRSTQASRKAKRFRAAYHEARQTGVPVDEVFGAKEEAYQRELGFSLERSAALEPERERVRDRVEGNISRRDFLSRGGLVGAGVVGLTMAGASGSRTRAANAATAPRVVVVGGGFAGLTAAYRINKLKGWAPQVYEASTRVGGRVETIRGQMQDGVYFEECASGISSNETGTGTIGNLASEVGLTPLVDTWLNMPDGNELYNYLGKSYTWNQLNTGYTAILDKCWTLWGQMGKALPTYQTTNTTAKTWDNKSVADLINSTAYPVTTPAGAYTAQIFGVEYGGPASKASAIHQIVEEGNFWGGSSGYDERWAIPGGNDTLASTLVAKLPAGSVHLDQALIAIKKNTDGTYTLTFQSSGGTVTTVTADRVVLAIPPTTMKYIDYSAAGFSALKVKTFAEPLGNSAKLAFQFNGQAWAPASGESYSDMVTGSSWTVQFQGTKSPHMLMMNNKDYGGTLPPIEQGAPSAVVTETLAAMDKLWPGMSTKFIPGKAYISQQTQNKFAGGCYSYRGLGGFTTYGDAEKLRDGNVHFAGEHTARYTHRGTMDGAVESGERAATEVTSY